MSEPVLRAPLSRRGLLRSVAVGGAVAALGSPAAADGRAYDPALPAGWTYPVIPELLPFGHAVMSGDPLPDRVVLWTRLTIPDPRGWDARLVPDPQGIRAVPVEWVVATDPRLSRVVRRGTVVTDASRDWTVKVDADRLPADTTLYYAFTALGHRSPVGRTRTAPAPDAEVAELTLAHVACTSWWQDVFNSYARIGERDDLDLVTHAGDHVYETCGGHPASRFPVRADGSPATSWDGDLDNREWRDVGECRRRYALYYADRNLARAHLAAPFAVMPDQHDDDDAPGITAAQAREVFWEWTAARPPVPDGSGAFPPAPPSGRQLDVPRGDAAAFFYRSLPFGRLADVVLLDVRRFARREGERSQVLGDAQWAWLEETLRASRDRGATHRVLLNQVNLSQLRAFNLPFADAFERQFAIDAQSRGELYTTAWGGAPAERRRLFRFLREEGVVDNVVLSGDSHGFFGSDLVEDPQAPSYEPVTGGGLLPPVGVEVVGSTMGRPGGQDVIAEQLCSTATSGSRGQAFADAATFDARYRPLALPAVRALEAAAQAANPNLRYMNWRAEYGHVVVQLQPARAVLECWTTPQRAVSPDQRLLAQFTSPVGAPRLVPVLAPVPVRGSRAAAAAPGAGLLHR